MISPLHNRIILLVISGGIAAYKSLDLIRRLREDGARVRCILTEGGARFITPLSVAALSGATCHTNLFGDDPDECLGHIRLSRESDLIVVAPASANMLAKMAHGMADNLASAVLLASDKPILIAPAMNCAMWQNPATQANMATLTARGVMQVGPASGMLACGEEGAGRMAEIDTILTAIRDHFTANKPLAGRQALVTSGPTYEPLDPVRFIGNRSSGKQGHALAQALAAQGANVTLVTGPTALPPPAGVQTVAVETAQEMLQACQTTLAQSPVDIAICAAAVADWRPSTTSEAKIKKDGAAPTVALTENPDILAQISTQGSARPKLVIGFAAETDNLLDNARAKFARKGCDWLVANQVGAGKGFAQDDNQVTLLQRGRDGAITADAWPAMSKQAIAQELTAAITRFFDK